MILPRGKQTLLLQNKPVEDDALNLKLGWTMMARMQNRCRSVVALLRVFARQLQASLRTDFLLENTHVDYGNRMCSWGCGRCFVRHSAAGVVFKIVNHDLWLSSCFLGTLNNGLPA
ncbi:MAG: hypothetical protein CL912_09690 [Deltaproteobacteria bacterium]|nr:hypothetical protein [Deltaproteobacteria bacterium]